MACGCVNDTKTQVTNLTIRITHKKPWNVCLGNRQGLAWGRLRVGGSDREVVIMVGGSEHWWRYECDDNTPLKPNYQLKKKQKILSNKAIRLKS